MNTKKLKELVLDLAIHGKLVPQDPNDEPASVLLERIRAEKERLVKEGKIKKSKKSATSDMPPYENNVPFEVPEGWVLCRGNEIFHQMESVKPSGDVFKYIDIESIDNKLNKVVSPKIIEVKNAPSRATRKTQKGDILFSLVRPYLRNIALVEEDDCIASTGFFVCKPNEVLLSGYCFYMMISDYVVNGLNSFMKGDNSPSINNEHIQNWVYPLPPLAEQQRIVAEIERWFAVIDELEKNGSDLKTAVEQAKKKVLDLAIRGKLVPQNPNDEPASELLKRLGVSSDNRPYENVPFEVPEGWVWTKLGEIGIWQAGGTPKRTHKEYYGGNIPWLKTGDLNDNYITFISENITEEGVDNSSAKLNPAGSVLIAMYGATIGKLGILTFPATTNQACCACIEYKGIEQKYLFYFLMYNKDEFIKLGGGGAQPNISKEIIVKTMVPLPPLAEQHRIVEKIEEIFSNFEKIKEMII